MGGESKHGTWELEKRKNAEEISFVNLYYVDYPAYETSWEISYTQDGNLGIASTSSEVNKIIFGDTDLLYVLPEGIEKKILSYYKDGI